MALRKGVLRICTRASLVVRGRITAPAGAAAAAAARREAAANPAQQHVPAEGHGMDGMELAMMVAEEEAADAQR